MFVKSIKLIVQLDWGRQIVIKWTLLILSQHAYAADRKIDNVTLCSEVGRLAVVTLLLFNSQI